MERHEILTAVYDALKAKRIVSSKGDFARQLGYTQPALSSALNGDTRYLTDRLMNTVLKTFPQVLASFVDTGEGEILSDIQLPQAELFPTETPCPTNSIDRLINTLEAEQALVRKAQEQMDKVIAQNDALISIIKEHLCK